MDETQKINQDYYNQNAEAWAYLKVNSFYHEKGFREFEKNLKEGDLVIDIGCAYGIHVPLFLGIGRKLRYEGVDISEKMLELARSRYSQLEFSCSNILDASTLPKKKFHAFWAAAVLMHIPENDWEKMLVNIELLVEKGGIGYFSIPHSRPNPASEKDQRHFTLLSDDALRALIEKRGWKLLATGSLEATASSTLWSWYVVRLQ